MKTGSPLAPRWEVGLLVVAVALMLGGVVMIFTDVSTAIAFPAIAVGIALTAIIAAEKRRHPQQVIDQSPASGDGAAQIGRRRFCVGLETTASARAEATSSVALSIVTTTLPRARP